MRKFIALMPWNLYLLLSTIKAIAEGSGDPDAQLPLLWSTYPVSSPLTVVVYAVAILAMPFCAWASYRILFKHSLELWVDTVPNYLILLGCRYLVPVIILRFITPPDEFVFNQPFFDNSVFWMATAYLLMTDTVFYWSKFRPEDKISIQVFGCELNVQVKYVFWITVLIETGYVGIEMNKYRNRPTEKREEIDKKYNE